MKAVYQPRPEVRLFGRRRHAFQVCGACGLCAAIACGLTLTLLRGLSPTVFIAILCTAVSVFFGLSLATKVVTGREKLVYYYHEIALLSAVALVLQVTKQPILQYLDITVLSLGLFLAFGRIGCLLAGCCHGRPHVWGVSYGADYTAVRFPAYLAGVVLLPVQAIESICVLAITGVGIAFWQTEIPGAALAWYVGSYGIVRFCLEFLRGDINRPYYLRLSEAQWISLASLAIAVQALWPPLLPIVPIVAASTVYLQYGRGSFQRQLGSPKHVMELADAAQRAAEGAPGIQIAETSLGIRLSSGVLGSENGSVSHLAVSTANGRFNDRAVYLLARLLARLLCVPSVTVIRGRNGVFHLLAGSTAAVADVSNGPLSRRRMGG